MGKRIAFISEHASPLATLGGVDSGGQNVYVDRLARNLAQLGYDIDIFTRWDNPDLGQVIDYAPSVRVVHIEAGPVEVMPKEDIFGYMDEFVVNMMKFISESGFHYELIHAHFWMSGYVAMKIKRRLNIPFAITFHALGKVRKIHQKEDDKFPSVRGKIEEDIVKAADHIVAECPQDKEDLMIMYFAEEEKISIVPCGFDTDEFYPLNRNEARMKLGLPQHEFIILQLGRMVPRKGVDNVIKGLGYVINKLNLPVRLVIVGGESDEPDPVVTPELGRLQQIAREEKVEQRITFAGRKNREELKYYYNACDVFITTPWYEPFGITPLESMACGTPVIGACVGGIKYSVVHGKTGFLVPPHNPEILGERIIQLYTRKGLLQKLRSNALQYVNENFTWRKVAIQISEIYQLIMNEKVETEKNIQNSFTRLLNFFNKKLSITEK